MGTIVVHAGMYKTGSSSIQKWLRDQSERLRSESGIAPLSASVSRSGEVRLALNSGRTTMNSWGIRAHCQRRPEDRERVARELCAQLDREAGASAIAVLSAEAFSHWLTGADESPFLDGLSDLAGRHRVRLAYYVRPQHAALESAWRARGYRSGRPPSRFLEYVSRRLHYLRTLRRVRELAPAIELAPRPFRRDLLDGGSIVADFARTFLGLDEAAAEIDEVWRNRGLPLELANAMQGAPVLAGEGAKPEGARPVAALLRLAERLDLAESEDVRRSRRVLQQACHLRFEDENRELIRELEWKTDAWVPPAGDAEPAGASFEPLDELWRPRASPAELALIHGAVAELGASEGRRHEAAAAGPGTGR